jgi:predicted ester cyclase
MHMSAEKNKTIVRRFFDELNRMNVAVYDELVAEDLMFNGAPVGREGMRGFSTMLRMAFPDLWVRPEALITEGDLVAVYYTWGGTHRQEYDGPEGRFAPTGKAFESKGMDLYRIRDGAIVEFWGVADRLDIQQQLGLIPAPAEATS